MPTLTLKGGLIDPDVVGIPAGVTVPFFYTRFSLLIGVVCHSHRRKNQCYRFASPFRCFSFQCLLCLARFSWRVLAVLVWRRCPPI